MGMNMEGPWGPRDVQGRQRFLSKNADGVQAGLMSCKASLPPLLPYFLTPERHFQQSLDRSRLPLPGERPNDPLDDDLMFAGHGQVAEVPG